MVTTECYLYTEDKESEVEAHFTNRPQWSLGEPDPHMNTYMGMVRVDLTSFKERVGK